MRLLRGGFMAVDTEGVDALAPFKWTHDLDLLHFSMRGSFRLGHELIDNNSRFLLCGSQVFSWPLGLDRSSHSQKLIEIDQLASTVSESTDKFTLSWQINYQKSEVLRSATKENQIPHFVEPTTPILRGFQEKNIITFFMASCSPQWHANDKHLIYDKFLQMQGRVCFKWPIDYKNQTITNFLDLSVVNETSPHHEGWIQFSWSLHSEKSTFSCLAFENAKVSGEKSLQCDNKNGNLTFMMVEGANANSASQDYSFNLGNISLDWAKNSDDFDFASPDLWMDQKGVRFLWPLNLESSCDENKKNETTDI